uniref:Uncharacterized protein n=1 Tax=Romanomermis culicivorax TaxID=13658 RepID=A0A915JEJ7_ROMCU
MYSGVLLDDLSNPLYGLSDLISYSMQGYNNIDFVKSLKAMKVASKMAKITFMAVGSKIGVPIIGTILSVSDTIAAWENYQNGDKSAFAIFNIVAGATSTIISIISLATGVLTLAGVAVTPVVGWILFAVGTAFYVIQNIWKVIDHFGGLKQFCIWSWEFTKSLPDIVQDPIKYLQSQKIEAADQIVSRALEILENNTKIQNVISTPICKQTIGHNYACQEIHIDFHQEVYIKKTEILPDRPKIIGKFAKKYKKLCPFHTAMGIIATYLTKDSSVYDYKCTNALAVGRITNGITHDPISLYMLHGNSSVHAIRDTVNIFQLSGGNRCSIRGGHRENTFIFSSAFQQCSIFGHEHSVNTADLSEIHSLNNYKIINGSMLEGVNSCTGQKSKIDMYYIGIVITEQHYNDSELEIVCSNISIVVKKQQEGLYFSRLYGIRVSNAQGCPYYLEITSHGSVNIDNQATNGKTVYTFPNVTGEVNMNLDNNRGTMTHSIMWKTISITEIRDVYIVVISLDLMIYQFGFTFKGYKTTLTLYNGTNSTQLMFADGLQLTFKDNSFVVEMLFPRSKGQLYDRYNQLFDNFRGAPLALNAYSDRDDELFVLTKNEIRFNRTTMPFSFFVTNYNQSIDEKVIKCKRGYNVILIKPSVSKATMQHILEKRAPWFDSFAIEMREELDFLIIDFTAVLDFMVEHINNTLMEFALIQNIYKQQVTINVSAASWINKLKKKYPIGSFVLKSDLINSQLFKRVKIMAQTNFIIMNDEQIFFLRILPLPINVSPLSPVVVLNRHSVQENHVIVFKDRSLPNYDLIELDDSTLIITNLASSIVKSYVITETSVPLISIIINDYKDDHMRSLTLKFEQGLALNIHQLIGKPMLNYNQFESKLSLSYESIAREGFSLEHDTR